MTTTLSNLSKVNDYEVAFEAHNAAYKIYDAARLAYRAREIEDAEFVAARQAFDSATALYDAAFDAAAREEF